MRLFVALDLSSALRTRLSFLMGGLQGARWVPPENLHLTVRFIGELPGWRADEMDLALAGVMMPGFELVLSGVGAFAKAGRVTSLYAGVERNAGLERLQAKVERALQGAGLAPEKRRFVPHVTLARLGARLGGDGVPEAKVAGWVQGHNLFRSAAMDVEHFTLFSSRLGKEQAVYCPEVEYGLGAAAAGDDGGAGGDAAGVEALAVQAAALEALASEVRACRVCADLPLGPRPILRVSRTATLLIASQAPGTKVHVSGTPWTDASGDRLRGWLGMEKDAFYDGARVAILPMGLCYPGRYAQGGDLPPRPACAPLWRGRLLALMPQLRLTLLVGSYAQVDALGPGRMTDRVRDFRAYLGRGYFPLPHPSWRTGIWERNNPWFVTEVLPALREAVGGLCA